MIHPRRIQNFKNGRIRSMSGAYRGKYRCCGHKRHEKHLEKAGIIDSANLLNNIRESNAKIISFEEMEKDKTSTSLMIGESAFFKEIEDALKIEVLSKMLTPGV